MAVRVFVFVFLFVGTCEAGTLLARSNGHGAARQQEHRSYEGSLAQQLASWTHPLQRCFTDIQPGFSNCLQSGTSASIRTVLAKFLGSVKNKYTASTRREVNVLVIGGGPGGFFAGLELLKRGFAVAVVEKYAHFTRARAVGLFTHQIKWFEDLGMEQATELPFGVPKEGSTVPEIQYVQRAAFLAAGGTLYMGCTVAQVTEDNQVKITSNPRHACTIMKDFHRLGLSFGWTKFFGEDVSHGFINVDHLPERNTTLVGEMQFDHIVDARGSLTDDSPPVYPERLTLPNLRTIDDLANNYLNGVKKRRQNAQQVIDFAFQGKDEAGLEADGEDFVGMNLDWYTDEQDPVKKAQILGDAHTQITDQDLQMGQNIPCMIYDGNIDIFSEECAPEALNGHLAHTQFKSGLSWDHLLATAHTNPFAQKDVCLEIFKYYRPRMPSGWLFMPLATGNGTGPRQGRRAHMEGCFPPQQGERFWQRIEDRIIGSASLKPANGLPKPIAAIGTDLAARLATTLLGITRDDTCGTRFSNFGRENDRNRLSDRPSADMSAGFFKVELKTRVPGTAADKPLNGPLLRMAAGGLPSQRFIIGDLAHNAWWRFGHGVLDAEFGAIQVAEALTTYHDTQGAAGWDQPMRDYEQRMRRRSLQVLGMIYTKYYKNAELEDQKVKLDRVQAALEKALEETPAGELLFKMSNEWAKKGDFDQPEDEY